MSDVTVTVFLV